LKKNVAITHSINIGYNNITDFFRFFLVADVCHLYIDMEEEYGANKENQQPVYVKKFILTVHY